MGESKVFQPLWAPWWRDHPAYGDIRSALEGHVVPSSASHLAFLMLVGLRERGWSVVREEKMLDN